MQPILPTIIRTGIAAIDRNLDQIFETFRRLMNALGKEITIIKETIPSPDDHKVAADSADAAPDYLQGKVKDGAHLTWTLDTTGGVRRMRPDVAWPAVPTGFPGYYEDPPKPLGVAAPGTSPLASHGDHIHDKEPTPQITNVYYVEPSEGQHHLVNPCPTPDWLHFAFPTTSAPDTPPSSVPATTLTGKPGLAVWSGGLCNVIIRAKVDGIIGTTHQVAVDLYRFPDGGGSPVRYCSASAPYVGPASTDYLTGDVKVFRFQVPVLALTGAASDLLVMTIYALPGIGGSVDTETLYIQTGADGTSVTVADATQIQTLFGSDTGGPIEHPLTTKRDLPDQHPMAAITPGRVHTPWLECTQVGGLVTVPALANGGWLSFSGDLKGIDSTGWSAGDECPLLLLAEPVTIRHMSSDVAAGNRLDLGYAGQFAPQDIDVTRFNCRLIFRKLPGTDGWALFSALEVT